MFNIIATLTSNVPIPLIVNYFLNIFVANVGSLAVTITRRNLNTSSFERASIFFSLLFDCAHLRMTCQLDKLVPRLSRGTYCMYCYSCLIRCFLPTWHAVSIGNFSSIPSYATCFRSISCDFIERYCEYFVAILFADVLVLGLLFVFQ